MILVWLCRFNYIDYTDRVLFNGPFHWAHDVVATNVVDSTLKQHRVPSGMFLVITCIMNIAIETGAIVIIVNWSVYEPPATNL